jgi:branched-chain amino acid aminotransferase
MINFNGMVSQDTNILTQNRAFFIWRCRFETVKIVNSKILFLEDHYFRLMASMRVRMEIPMNFTMEYLEEQIVSLATLNSLSGSSRARITVSGMMEDIICLQLIQSLF